jgi:DNA replication protein DnaC
MGQVKKISIRNTERIMADHLFIYVDEFCTEETCLKSGEGKPVHKNEFRKMQNLITGEIYCTKCRRESQELSFTESESERHEAMFGTEAQKHSYLKRYSIIGERELFTKNKGLKDYIPTTPEAIKNKDLATQALLKIVGGTPINVLITGKSGCGKSHLSFGIANNVNEMSRRDGHAITVVYFNYKKIYNLITASFDDKSMKGRDYFLKIAENAQCLVLDDVGSELKKDSAYSSELLTEILDSREEKQTIITSNYNFESLKQLYDPRFTSRLSRYQFPITFSDTGDYRAGQIVM